MRLATVIFVRFRHFLVMRPEQNFQLLDNFNSFPALHNVLRHKLGCLIQKSAWIQHRIGGAQALHGFDDGLFGRTGNFQRFLNFNTTSCSFRFPSGHSMAYQQVLGEIEQSGRLLRRKLPQNLRQSFFRFTRHR